MFDFLIDIVPRDDLRASRRVSVPLNECLGKDHILLASSSLRLRETLSMTQPRL